MKKFTKIVLIACGVMAVLGIALTVCGFSAVGFNGLKQAVEEGKLSVIFDTKWKEEIIRHDSEIDKKEWEYENLDEITSLNIDSDYSTIHIQESQEQQGTIQIMGQQGSKWDQITVELRDGTIFIKEKCSNVPSIDNDNSYIRVTVPVGFSFDNVNIDSDAGKVSYDISASCEIFECSIDAGGFIAENINCGTGTISVDAGSIISKKCLFGEATIQCNAGEIQLKKVSLNKELNLECDAGKVEVELEGQESDYGFILKSSLGSIKIDGEEYSGVGSEIRLNEQLPNTVSINCNMGSVKVTFTEE